MTKLQIKAIHKCMSDLKIEGYQIQEQPTQEMDVGRKIVWLEEVREFDKPNRSYAPLVVEVDFDLMKVTRVIGNLW